MLCNGFFLRTSNAKTKQTKIKLGTSGKGKCAKNGQEKIQNIVKKMMHLYSTRFTNFYILNVIISYVSHISCCFYNIIGFFAEEIKNMSSS